MSIADKAKDKAKRNPEWMLGILVVLHLIALSLNRVPGQPGMRVLQVVLMTVTTPFQSGIGNSAGWLSEQWKGYFQLRRVREENEWLKSERIRLASEQLVLREQLARYGRLGPLVEAGDRIGSQAIRARVVGRDVSRLFGTVVIDKGSFHGVSKNQPVVDAMGLVGRVVLVTPYSSRVILITDERHGAGSVIATTLAGRLLGIVRGARDSYYCQMDFITAPVNIDNGEPVLTSGQDGIYPPGLLIGRVANPTDQPVSTQQRLVVAPAAELGRLEIVSVLQVTREQIRGAVDAVIAEEQRLEKGPINGPIKEKKR